MARHDMKGLKNIKNTKEETEEQESLSFWNRVTGLRDKLKLGPHHKMERFSIMIGITVSFLLLFTTLSFAANRSDVANLASSQAIYTESFNFSLSNQKMYVEGVYGNKDQTDVMVLLRMQDVTSMSADAKNYDLYITGEKKSISYTPKVSFSLFGSTGYGIIRFQDDEPLKKEILDVTIRANASLSSEDGTGTSGDKDDTDASFSKYDQGKLYVNPGAENVKTLDWLKTGEEDPSKLYIALVAEAKDEEIHKEIEKQVKELNNLLNRSTEYTNRLVSSGYEEPSAPWFMKGDYVSEKGALVAAKNLSRAYELDYTTKTIRDGYINQVMKDVSEFDAYMKEHTNDTSADSRNEEQKEQVDSIKTLKYEDGSTLDLNEVSTGSSPSAQVAAKDSVESLQATWRSYVKTKGKLQRDLMRDLLILDADVQSQKSGFSTHTGKGAVTLY